ncbi:MAG: 3-oxoacyl-ACP synthase [Deltaproteobacteria bacterium]|nr:3-oxoacyl-ACP synthase [Deltaproteobacteria bacterium]
MGTRIESAATSFRRGRLFGRGALHLTDAAARACLERAHHRADELDLLINAGIYKDRNTAEPALASIIQEDIGANLGGPVHMGHHGTFSFDVLNGACGVITAAQLIDGFVGHGSARLGMVVAADADPSPRTSRQFPFSPAGGAVLLAHIDGDGGFQRFELRTFPEHATLFETRLRWDPEAGFAHRGRNVLEVYEAPAFASCCVERAAEVVGATLATAGLTADDIDLVLASQYPRGFGTQVARRLGIPTDRVPEVRAELVAAHTAGPIAALEASIRSRRFAVARHSLFVTAGAGITIGVALYRN